MSILIDRIKQNIYDENRNYCGLWIGRVGSGKSWSCLRVAEQLDPTFDVEKRVIFRIKDLLRMVVNGELPPGSVVVFDEAGIDASNRQSYMNKLNKALSYLMQTWRHRRIIMFVTIPDISYIDAGVRKLFDDVFETKKIMKKEKVVIVNAKHIQVNLQTGDVYYKRFKMDGEIIALKIKKPSIPCINRYEKMKTKFTTELYKDIERDLIGEKPGSNKKDDPNRCPKCGNKGRKRMKTADFRCHICGLIWK
jgi:hypothetical protein